jgi:parallel beta-helix repeat protein
LRIRIVTWIILVLFLTTISFYDLQLVKAYGKIYIKADGSIIRANGNVDHLTVNILNFNNVTYTFTDNNYDDIVVERDNIVIDGAGYTLQGDGIGYGISLFERHNVTIKNMEIDAFSFGIWLSDSHNNTILGTILKYNAYGIALYNSSNATLTTNILRNNHVGIRLVDSQNNTISTNLITNNTHGIRLYTSFNNTLLHNSFIENNNQAYTPSSVNTWNAGYPFGGNYWDDYNETDIYCGPYQNETGSDDLGDIPYEIDHNNTDNYPLMKPYTLILGDLHYDYKIDMRDIGVAAWSIGSYPTHPRWNKYADLNQDNRLDMKDLVIIARNFGKTY